MKRVPILIDSETVGFVYLEDELLNLYEKHPYALVMNPMFKAGPNQRLVSFIVYPYLEE
jgi:hypothetical protein